MCSHQSKDVAQHDRHTARVESRKPRTGDRKVEVRKSVALSGIKALLVSSYLGSMQHWKPLSKP